MSKNSELILAGYEAWNRDDLDAYLETLHPDVELHTSGLFPDFDSVYRGHTEVAEFWHRLHEPWKDFHIEIEQIVEEGPFSRLRGDFAQRASTAAWQSTCASPTRSAYVTGC